MFAGASGAMAADVLPAAPSWNGFYGGVYIGLTKGLKTDLQTTSSAEERRTVGWCQNTQSGNRFQNANTQSECEDTVEAVWSPAVAASCPEGYTASGNPNSPTCTKTELATIIHRQARAARRVHR